MQELEGCTVLTRFDDDIVGFTFSQANLETIQNSRVWESL